MGKISLSNLYLKGLQSLDRENIGKKTSIDVGEECFLSQHAEGNLLLRKKVEILKDHNNLREITEEDFKGFIEVHKN
ncbi:hypothetical protein ACFTQL_10305 [Peribacillus butanolivorans]|uniref:hypothetical protein n=1 Tax=Peribacillus butanolivorans TaxID=421767 RepID=UPI003633032E